MWDIIWLAVKLKSASNAVVCKQFILDDVTKMETNILSPSNPVYYQWNLCQMSGFVL